MPCSLVPFCITYYYYDKNSSDDYVRQFHTKLKYKKKSHNNITFVPSQKKRQIILTSAFQILSVF